MTGTWQEELRAKGYRVTPQRQLVLEAVTALEHGTPEEICTAVQRTAQGVNISTVYRTLELLEELSLVKHAHLGHGPPTYHLAVDAEHVHLVCRGCGAVSDVSPTSPTAWSRRCAASTASRRTCTTSPFTACAGTAKPERPPWPLGPLSGSERPAGRNARVARPAGWVGRRNGSDDQTGQAMRP
jgi:Fe2+/Zn2+ uptake regulation proteins